MRYRKYISYVSAFLVVIVIGLLMSWKSIPNQEGYYEVSWNLTYLDFKKYILWDIVTPINFLLPYLLVKITPLSLANAWKIIDLFFGGLVAVFLSYQANKRNQFIKFSDMLKTPLLIAGSIGAILPLTSMTGEGLSVLVSLLGLHAWISNSFILGGLLFCVAFLSKYTIYLILPGIGIWTLMNWLTFTQAQRRRIIFSGVMLLSAFFLYQSLKNWGDILSQAGLSNVLYGFKSNPPYFIVVLVIGSPIILTLSLLKPNLKHLFWICSLSAFICFQTRYLIWHYPYQIIPLLFYFVLTQPGLMKLISYRMILLQLVFTLCLYLTLPLKIDNIILYPKHVTYDEMNKVAEIIKTSYSGGKVGYYMNRPFDEPFPVYEISYMDPSSRFQIEQTEYVVLPNGIIPQILTSFPGCELRFVKTVQLDSIYKVTCTKGQIKSPSTITN